MGRIKQKTASMKHLISEDFEFFHYRDSHIRSFEFKNHEVYEIFFLISGNVTYLVDGRTYSLIPGDILLINNKELHKPVLGPKEIYERIIMWIKPEFLTNHSTEDCNLAACFEHISTIRHNHVRFDPSMQKKVKNSILLLEEACNSSEFGSNILRNSYLMQIIVYLNRYFTGVPETSLQVDIGSNEKINNVIKYIHENLTIFGHAC
jgi:hypothetical protein